MKGCEHKRIIYTVSFIFSIWLQPSNRPMPVHSTGTSCRVHMFCTHTLSDSSKVVLQNSWTFRYSLWIVTFMQPFLSVPSVSVCIFKTTTFPQLPFCHCHFLLILYKLLGWQQHTEDLQHRCPWNKSEGYDGLWQAFIDLQFNQEDILVVHGPNTGRNRLFTHCF